MANINAILSTLEALGRDPNDPIDEETRKILEVCITEHFLFLFSMVFFHLFIISFHHLFIFQFFIVIISSFHFTTFSCFLSNLCFTFFSYFCQAYTFDPIWIPDTVYAIALQWKEEIVLRKCIVIDSDIFYRELLLLLKSICFIPFLILPLSFLFFFFD